MPIYEYRCRTCGKAFELLRSLRAADSDLECPSCHSTEVVRQLSTFAAAGCGSGSRGFT